MIDGDPPRLRARLARRADNAATDVAASCIGRNAGLMHRATPVGQRPRCAGLRPVRATREGKIIVVRNVASSTRHGARLCSTGDLTYVSVRRPCSVAIHRTC